MKNKLLKLFTTTFTLSTFTFGGGFVIVSLYKKKFADELQWVDEQEILDIVSIAQSSPGPIPVNASVILGYRIANYWGSFVAVLGTVLPAFIIMSLISMFYEEFKSIEIISTAMLLMRAGVAAVILDVVWDLAKKIIKEKQYFYVFQMIIAFIAVYFLKVSAMLVVIACLGIGIVQSLIDYKKEGVA